jgi:hypothetical protein
MENPITFIENLGKKIATFFGSHEAAIQSVIKDAQGAQVAAKDVALALGEPSSVITVISGIGDGLQKTSDALAAESSSTTLTQEASNLSGLVSSVVDSGDIGIKNAQTQAAVGTTLQKVVGVVSALQTASNATTAPATPAAS